jgi:hypothetical protein
MEALIFLFGNFWHFMGVCVLITIIGIIIKEIVTVIVKARALRTYFESVAKETGDKDDKSEI